MPERKVPLRQCMGCREHKPKGDLYRVVRSPEGQVTLDTKGKAPGRGVYLCPDPKCFARIKKSRGLDRALGVSVPGSVYDEIQQRMEEETN